METGWTETPGGGRPGRRLDRAVWGLVIAALIGLAAAVAWSLSTASFKLRDITFEDDSVDFELIPVAPTPEPPPPATEPSAARKPDAEGVSLPVWTRQPAPLYPALALRRGIEEGEVQLVCEALASGEPTACEVVHENPAGAGFGEAALASMHQARVTPRTVEGRPVAARIRFTIRFRIAP